MSDPNPVCPEPGLFDFKDYIRYIGLVMFILGTVFQVLTIAWWVVRRDHFLLRKRSLSFVVYSAIGLWFQIFTTGMGNYKTIYWIPCDVQLWTVYMIVPLAVGPIITRLVIFYNKARYSQLLLQDQASGSDAGGQNLDAVKFMNTSLFQQLRILYKFKTRRAKQRRVDMRNARKSRISLKKKHVAISPVADSGSLQDASGGTEADLMASGIALYLMTTYVYSILILGGWLSIGAIFIAIKYLQKDTPYGQFKNGCYGCTMQGLDSIFLGIMVLFVVTVGSYMIYILRDIPDPLGILKEIRLVLSVGLLIVGGIVLSAIDPGGLIDDGIWDWYYVVSFLCMVIHYIQCPMIVRKTYKVNTAKDTEISLDTVLATRSSKEAFLRYLATEFSVENLYFYDAVNSYKKNHAHMSPSLALANAEEIWQKYVAEGSLLEVNVSSIQRTKVAKALKPLLRKTGDIEENDKPAENLFDECKDEIINLMKLDSYPRFLKSSHYVAWKADGGLEAAQLAVDAPRGSKIENGSSSRSLGSFDDGSYDGTTEDGQNTVE